jgi:hypothetical protein
VGRFPAGHAPACGLQRSDRGGVANDLEAIEGCGRASRGMSLVKVVRESSQNN